MLLSQGHFFIGSCMNKIEELKNHFSYGKSHLINTQGRYVFVRDCDINEVDVGVTQPYLLYIHHKNNKCSCVTASVDVESVITNPILKVYGVDRSSLDHNLNPSPLVRFGGVDLNKKTPNIPPKLQLKKLLKFNLVSLAVMGLTLVVLLISNLF